MLRKLTIRLLVVFLAFYLFTRPESAAAAVTALWAAFYRATDAITGFLTHLT